MGTLFLVRHGQASFGAADYDNLSALGIAQSQRLGEYWAGKGLQFDAVLTGTLRRHAQTFAGIQAGMGTQHEPLIWPGLNEYDSESVIAAIHRTFPGKVGEANERAARAARMTGDNAAAKAFDQRLLKALEPELATRLPDYDMHRAEIDRAAAEARRPI